MLFFFSRTEGQNQFQQKKTTHHTFLAEKYNEILNFEANASQQRTLPSKIRNVKYEGISEGTVGLEKSLNEFGFLL